MVWYSRDRKSRLSRVTSEYPLYIANILTVQNPDKPWWKFRNTDYNVVELLIINYKYRAL